MASFSDVMQMCRLCLVKDQVNLPIFGGQGDLQQIFLKITACLPVKVSREDNLPKNICDGCSYKLDMLYQFWNTSSNSEKQLIDWLNAAGVDPKHKSLETPLGITTQPNVILKQEPVTELDSISSDTQNYIMQQQQLAYKPEEFVDSFKESQATAKSTKKKAAEPAEEAPSKRPRRATRSTRSVVEDEEEEDDFLDNVDSGITKTEDDSDEDDDDGDDDGGMPDADPDFETLDEDADADADADADQPGPSGVSGSKASTGPSMGLDNYPKLKSAYGLKDCIVFVGEASEFDNEQFRFMRTQSYCDVDKTNILVAPRLKYKCDECPAKFRDHYRLILHKEEIHVNHTFPTEEIFDVDDDSAKMVADRNAITLTSLLQSEPPTPRDANSTDVPSSSTTSDSKRHRCTKCVQRFALKGELAMHLKEVHNVFSCKLCPQTFFSKNNMEVHMVHKHQSNNGKWKCKSCQLSFGHYDDLIEHNLDTHKLVCGLCKNDFPNIPALMTHKNIHHGVPLEIICDICGLTTNTSVELGQHMKLHVSEAINCDLCNEVLHGEEVYANHVMMKHVGPNTKKLFKCTVCKLLFESKPAIYDHMRTAHSMEYEERMKKKPKTVPPSPEILNHTLCKQFPSNVSSVPSLKIKLVKQPPVQPVTNIPATNESHYVISKQSTSSQHSQQSQKAKVKSIATPVTKNPITNSVKVCTTTTTSKPDVGLAGPSSLQTSIEQGSMVPQLVQLPQMMTSNKPESKLLVIDKNKQAYLLPAYMVNQNGQMKIAFKGGSLPETSLSEQFTVPPMNTSISQTFVTPSNPTTININNTICTTNIVRSARAPLPKMQRSVAKQSPDKNTDANPPPLVLRQYKAKKTSYHDFKGKFDNLVDRMPSPHSHKPSPKDKGEANANADADAEKQPPIHLEKSQAAVDDAELNLAVANIILDDIVEPEEPDIQIVGDSLGSTYDQMSSVNENLREISEIEKRSEKVTSMEDKTSEPERVHIDESLMNMQAPNAGHCIPKIFLKPLSQLLEMPKHDDPIAAPSTTPSTTPQLMKISPDKVPVFIRQINEKLTRDDLGMSSSPFERTTLMNPLDPAVPSTSNINTSAIMNITADKVPEYKRKVSEKLRGAEGLDNALICDSLNLQNAIQIANPNLEASSKTGDAGSSETGGDVVLAKKEYKCDMCNMIFKRAYKLRAHQRKLKCKLCTYTGCKLKDLDTHYRIKHNFKNQCITCDIKFDTTALLQVHNKSVHYCMKCNKFYTSIEKHCTMYTCIKCNDFECSANKLSEHYLQVHQINHICSPCKQFFVTEPSFLEHKRQVHFCTRCSSFKMNLSVHQKFCKGDHSYSGSNEPSEVIGIEDSD